MLTPTKCDNCQQATLPRRLSPASGWLTAPCSWSCTTRSIPRLCWLAPSPSRQPASPRTVLCAILPWLVLTHRVVGCCAACRAARPGDRSHVGLALRNLEGRRHSPSVHTSVHRSAASAESIVYRCLPHTLQSTWTLASLQWSPAWAMRSSRPSPSAPTASCWESRVRMFAAIVSPRFSRSLNPSFPACIQVTEATRPRRFSSSTRRPAPKLWPRLSATEPVQLPAACLHPCVAESLLSALPLPCALIRRRSHLLLPG